MVVGHTSRVNRILATPEVVVSTSFDKTVKLWDFEEPDEDDDDYREIEDDIPAGTLLRTYEVSNCFNTMHCHFNLFVMEQLLWLELSSVITICT